jgi:anti-sigma-K factor RskA
MSRDQFSGELNNPSSSSDSLPGEETLCPEVMALIPAYSLGATDPDERSLVNNKLADCPQAAQELAAYTALSEALLYSAHPVQPPAGVEDQLRRALGQTGVRPQSVAKSTPTATSGWSRRWRWSAMWSAAAAAIILLLITLDLFSIQQILAWRTAYQTLLQQNNELSQEEKSIYILLASDERQTIDLPAIQPESEFSAEVLWTPEVDLAMLYVTAFPALPKDQVYQLWLVYNGQRNSAGTFTVDQRGNGVLVFLITQPLDQTEIIGITPEPVGGSPGPTGAPVARRRL